MSDTEKIIEISLAKIEHSKAKKGPGKLHKNLLVNSIINKVRETESGKTCLKPLMNYRESKLIMDLDNEDYDLDRVLMKDRPSTQHRVSIQSPLSRKQSSLVSQLNTRSIGITEPISRLSASEESIEMKENIQTKDMICECASVKLTTKEEDIELPKRTKKRIHSIEVIENDCPRKRLRCLWTPNIDQKIQDPSFSVSTLSSLFGNLVAHSDAEKNLELRNKFVSAMVAC